MHVEVEHENAEGRRIHDVREAAKMVLREIEKVLQKEDRNHRSHAGSILDREDNAMTDQSISYVLVVNKWNTFYRVHKNGEFWSEKIVRQITWPTSHDGDSELETPM